MKKKLNFFLVCAFVCTSVFAVKQKEAAPLVESKYSFEYREVAQQLQEPSAPFERDGLIIFSAEEGPHYVGIVFDFENFQKIHKFQKKIILDENGERQRTWYFFILEDYPQVERIRYRLIIDGLWTTDPLNDKQFYDPKTGLRLSQLNVTRKYESETSVKNEGGKTVAHFVYKGKPNQRVRLAGNFTKWDSWVYELKETSRGYYELSLPLPKGTYYYVYYIGTNAFPDITNHERAYKDDNEQPISKLVVN